MIDAVDFHLDNHLIQFCNNHIYFFVGGDTTVPGTELGTIDDWLLMVEAYNKVTATQAGQNRNHL